MRSLVEVGCEFRRAKVNQAWFDQMVRDPEFVSSSRSGTRSRIQHELHMYQRPKSTIEHLEGLLIEVRVDFVQDYGLP